MKKISGLLALLQMVACVFAMHGLAGSYSLDVALPGHSEGATVVFVETIDPVHPKILEVDMKGEVVWEYEIPREIVSGSHPGQGADIEWIPETDNLLFVMPFKGIYEVNRKKEIVWKYENPQVTHDADRLPSGNTLMCWGWDSPDDAQLKEVDSEGNIVWQWKASDHLDPDMRRHPGTIARDGFTHNNSVARLENGNTMISLRNFNMLLEVGPSGDLVWMLQDLPNGKQLKHVHNPKVLADENILCSLHGPQVLLILTRQGEIVWKLRKSDIELVRYNEKLANGNFFLVDFDELLEVSPEGKVLWRLSKPGVTWVDPKTFEDVAQKPGKGKQPKKNLLQDPREIGFYKAEMIPGK